MSTLAVELHPQAYAIQCTETDIIIELIDGRTISAPLVWFPRLSQATQQQLDNWELLGDGEGIHWPEVDEDLSVAGLLMGSH
jgi:hypothetical protein